MIRNYLKIAFRNLFKYKLFSFINIFGLALSMSICMLVLLRIKDQLAYDQFHPHKNRIYRLVTELRNKEGTPYRLASTPLPLADVLEKDYALAERWVRLYPAGTEKATAVQKELSIHGAFADETFFGVFGFTLAEGNPKTALKAPNSIVLTKETAEKFFGKQELLGQVVHMERLGDFQVTGIMQKAKGKSHIDFDAYLSMSSVPLLQKSGKHSFALDQWSLTTAAYTYIVAKEGVAKEPLNKAMQQIADKLEQQSSWRWGWLTAS